MSRFWLPTLCSSLVAPVPVFLLLQATAHLPPLAPTISSEWNVLIGVHQANSHAPFQSLLLGTSPRRPTCPSLCEIATLQICLSVHFTFPKAPFTSSLHDSTLSCIYGRRVRDHETHRADISALLKDAPNACTSLNHGVWNRWPLLNNQVFCRDTKLGTPKSHQQQN